MNNQNPPKMYSMFDVVSQDNGIYYIENVLSYPDELLSHVMDLELQEDSYQRISEWSDWHASDDKSILYGQSKTIYSDQFITPLQNEILQRKTLYIKNSIAMAAEMSVSKYLSNNGLDREQYKFNDDNYYIKKWNVGSFMGPHSDGNYSDNNLALSIVIYLNDNYDGGEISFPEKNITIKPKLGSAIIFSSNEMHEVLPVKNGDRYMSPKHMYRV